MYQVYLNLGDVKACGGVDLNLGEGEEQEHVRLVTLLDCCPGAGVVREVLQPFLTKLQPLASVLVPLPLSTPRLLRGLGPRIQLKMEACSRLNSDGEEAADDDVLESEDIVDVRGLKNSSHNVKRFQGPYHKQVDDLHKEKMVQFECNLCDLTFFSNKELDGHMRLDHESSGKEIQLKCDKCEKVFSSRKTKFAHMRGIHNISSKPTKKEPPGPVVCPICGEKKKSDHNLQQHIKKFHENAFPNPIACHLCSGHKQLRSRKYHTPFSYDLHVKQIHSGGTEGKVSVVCFCLFL